MSGIDDAMMWQMQTIPPKTKRDKSCLARDLSDEVEEAMAHYARTRHQAATLCLVDPCHGPIPSDANGCTIQTARSVPPFHLLVGVPRRAEKKGSP